MWPSPWRRRWYHSYFAGKVRAGQLRSVKDPSQCVTITGMDYRTKEEGFDPKNGHLSLRPCAKNTNDKLMERQWFDDLTRKIRFRGSDKRDVALTSIVYDGELVSMTTDGDDFLHLRGGQD